MTDVEDFIKALLIEFEANGASAIERVCKESPLEFLKLCLAVIQEDIRISVNAGDATGEMH
jgi:hypothetical protein